MPPELPQIDTGEGAPTFQVPPTVGVQRLDVDRPNPALTAVREQGTAIENKAAYLGAQIKRQEIANQALGAESDYITKSTQLESSLEGVTDPAQKLQMYQKGLQNIQDTILKNNPGITPSIQGQLGIRMAESMRTANHQYIIDAHGQAINDITAKKQDALIAITNAPTQQDADQLLNNTHQWMEETAKNGFFQKGELEPMMEEFDYKVKYSLFQKLAGVHPVEALQMPLSQTRLTVKDFRTLTDEAHTNILNARNMADIGRIQDQTDYTNKFNAHQTTPAQDNEMANRGLLSKANFMWRYGRPPTDTQSQVELSKVTDMLHNIDTDDPEAITRWSIDHITNNTNLRGDARAAAGKMASLMVQEANTDMGKANLQSMTAIKSFAYREYPQVFNTKLTGDPFSGVRRQMLLEISNAKSAIHFEKTEEGRQRIVQQTIKQLGVLGETTKPAPKASTSTDMPATSVTPAEPEASSTPVSNEGLK